MAVLSVLRQPLWREIFWVLVSVLMLLAACFWIV